MLTKIDIKQLLTAFKEVFQTKDEAQMRHDAVIIKLNTIEKRVSNVEHDVTSFNEAMVPILGNLHEWTDEIHNEVVREKLLKRVKRLERHLGVPTLVG